MASAVSEDLASTVRGAEHFRIDGDEVGCPVVISFSFAFWDKNSQFDFEGRLKKLRLLSGRRFNCVFLKDPSSSWYSNGVPGLGSDIDQVSESLKEIIAELGSSEVITIGQSMGAYAAMLFGGLLDADRIIAFAPLAFLDVRTLCMFGDKRYSSALENVQLKNEYSNIVRFFDNRPFAGKLNVLFGSKNDPKDETVNMDAVHAMKLSELDCVSLHSIDGAGHLVVKHLVDSGDIDNKLLDMVFDMTLEKLDTEKKLNQDWYDWILENIVAGCPPEKLIKGIKSQNIEFKGQILREIEMAEANPYVRSAKKIQHKLDKRNWLLDTYHQLSGLAGQQYELATRTTPEFDIFVKEFYSQGVPVKLLAGIEHWPAREKWNPSYFSERVGSKQVEVQFNRSQDHQYERNSRKYKQKMRMDEFCHLVVEGGDSNDYYLTANNNQASLSELALLFEDVGDFGKGYRIPETIKKRSHLWFGPKGAFTPLHHDLTNNMLVQIYGRKKLTLIPAFQVPHLYNDTHVYSATDFPVVDIKRFPKMKNVTPIEMILNPGEAVFIPIGWWHCVESLDVSISVSFTDFNVKNDFFVNFPKILR